jgi:hypothetical protein
MLEEEGGFLKGFFGKKLRGKEWVPSLIAITFKVKIQVVN